MLEGAGSTTVDVQNVSAVSVELVPGCETLLILFGGIAGAIGMPPFEFYRAAKVIDCSKIFLRDLKQAWYQEGLPAIGDNLFAIRDFLADQIAASGASRVRFVGNSMGGFAALLFCSLLRCGRAIAFAPQTFISPEKRLLHGDTRWGQEMDRLHQLPSANHIYDLRSRFLADCPSVEGSVYVCSTHSLDLAHASELEDFSNIRIHRLPRGGHELVTVLRDTGELVRILEE